MTRRGHGASGSLLLAALAVLAAAAPAPAQEPSIELQARRLLDTPQPSHGDWEAMLQDLVELVREDPSGPLVEAALRLLSSRFTEFARPVDAYSALIGIDPEPFDPAARRAYDVLFDRLRVRYGAPAQELARDPLLFRDFLREFKVLGPLGPEADARGALDPHPALTDPGFERAHDGVDEELRWVPLGRNALRRSVVPHEAVGASAGRCLLAARPLVAGGGPGYLELEVLFPQSGTRPDASFRGALPGCLVALNGSIVHEIDAVREPGPTVRRIPVVWRDGANELVLQTGLEPVARPRIAVRMLDANGSPHADRAPGWAGGMLGSVVDAQAPPAFRDVVLRLVEEADGVGANVHALLGALLVLDARHSEGLPYLRRAMELGADQLHLRWILASANYSARHLPEVFRRSRARRLAESILEHDPAHYAAGSMVASMLAVEDREEEALELLGMLESVHPSQYGLPLMRVSILRSLGLTVQAEEALAQAVANAPASPRVLDALAAHAAAVGQVTRAAQLRLQVARTAGSLADGLADAAAALLAAGRVEEASALQEELLLRYPGRGGEVAAAHADRGRYDDARRLLLERLEHRPRSASARLDLADLALREGDLEAEQRWLAEASRLAPWAENVRRRLRSAGHVDKAREFFELELLDVEAVLADFDGSVVESSTVLVIDHAILWYFEDGASEQLSQNVYQARDLEGCEALGSLPAQGDLVRCRTWKSDGSKVEPVEVDGEYVMPSLEPGDFVEYVYREVSAPPVGDIYSSSGWFFASQDQPFWLTRFVVSVPEGLPVTPRARHLDGELSGVSSVDVSSRSEAGRTVHVYEAARQPRVLPEPGQPAPGVFLPRVSFGYDDSRERIAAYRGVQADWYSRVTPEIQMAADQAIAGVEGQDAQARALHRFVRDQLDRRGSEPRHATHALLGREGSPTSLYLALLDAAHIPADRVWARPHAPGEEPEAEPEFLNFGRWVRPLVRVRPQDAEPAWCDMGFELLPYGVLPGIAPGAEALVGGTGELLQVPEMLLRDRPSIRLSGTLEVQQDGSANIEGRCDLVAVLGYALKDQAREVPENQRTFAVRNIARRAVAGLEVEGFELEGIDSEDDPLALVVRGRVRTFLDRDTDGYSAPLPLPALGLGASYADEGQRKLPFFFDTPLVSSFEGKLVLPEGIELVEGPPLTNLSCTGGTYSLSLERITEREWLLVREVELGAFRLEPRGYRDFIRFCAEVDELERSRLRFE